MTLLTTGDRLRVLCDIQLPCQHVPPGPAPCRQLRGRAVCRSDWLRDPVIVLVPFLVLLRHHVQEVEQEGDPSCRDRTCRFRHGAQANSHDVGN